MKVLSIFRNEEGIIVNRKNQFGTVFKSVFQSEKDLLTCLDGYKNFGNIEEYNVEVSNDLEKMVSGYLELKK